MKIILIIIFLQTCVVESQCQNQIVSNYNYQPGFQKLLLRTDTTKLGKNDVEIRFWYDNGANRINTTHYITLLRLKNKWQGGYYKFVRYTSRDSLIVQKFNINTTKLDSIYTTLLENNIMEYESKYLLELINTRLRPLVIWTDAGPTNYLIEILQKNSRKSYYTICPNYFFREANIPEFEKPLKIVSTLLWLVGITPC